MTIASAGLLRVLLDGVISLQAPLKKTFSLLSSAVMGQMVAIILALGDNQGYLVRLFHLHKVRHDQALSLLQSLITSYL
jgi:hypothetical protein